jgi:hypothetical protein
LEKKGRAGIDFGGVAISPANSGSSAIEDGFTVLILASPDGTFLNGTILFAPGGALTPGMGDGITGGGRTVGIN